MFFERTSAILFSLFFLGFDCNTTPQQQAPVKPHPTPIVKDTDYCDAAQQNLLKLNCAEGSPTKRGKSFGDFCRETQSHGIFLNPKCLSEVTDCKAVNACTPTKARKNEL